MDHFDSHSSLTISRTVVCFLMDYCGLCVALTVHHSPALLYCLQAETPTISLTSLKVNLLVSLQGSLRPGQPLATLPFTPLSQLTPSGLVILVTETLLK